VSNTSKIINLTLKIWRQENPASAGAFKNYPSGPISTDMSFLEMLDVVNEALTQQGEEPVAFDHDCREGICGACGTVINGQAHGHLEGTTLCQLHMRNFKDGDTIVIEPFRSRAFPLIKDLMVDRSALDTLVAEGGYVSVNTGGAIEANSILIPQQTADQALDASECIGCGACVAACPNGSAMLFVSAKVSQLALLPQGQPERAKRALAMVRKMDALGFGSCGNERECEAACPKQISITNIARLNREYLKASLFSREK
jgi:succinate dehydrogenase / fumarate reductase, iron-sulfur subunit